ncbi:DUF1972 domain-containing protein [Aurantibacillus circumpalustris]|uniref:DUF1972 domain-containing protein n=1 Tax=Aurantibacillus circumpalustris TaxID=3036359 RepID=UPI00295ACEEE|nr:DUF1972 domain-containing protein [Aurantibacillus circumpalustris]
MKIAIIGTRGIPNNYGGFEQLAEYLSLGLIEHGHSVFVYNSHKHVYQEKVWKGVNIIHQYDPEKTLGTIGQFIYDFKCIVNTRKHKFDVILNLGYTSSSVWMHLFPKNSYLVTNMDGLEWKRSKYSKNVQRFLKYAESLAVKMSDDLIADSMAIKEYLQNTYKVDSKYVAYGADLFDMPDVSILNRLKILPYSYNMLIARMEPENNIEMILDGVHEAKSNHSFLVIGNYKNKFGTYLKEKYRLDERIVFMGPIYEIEIVNNLRFYSNFYFHGHSVGGTNPSLIEAMGCHCLIAAHDNVFNRSVLLQNAFYFKEVNDVRSIIEIKENKTEINKDFVKINYEKVKSDYSWKKIVQIYEQILTSNAKS